MRFATFVAHGEERFGIVLSHPATGEDWVFDPERAEELLHLYASAPTSPLRVNVPRFIADRPWPRELADFLALGDEGMHAAHRLRDFLIRFLAQADQCLIAQAGYPVSSVKLRAPIPRPRLLFGLVANSATFWRNDPSRTIVNVYPQGHARPQGSVIGVGDPVIIGEQDEPFGWNPELGVIIGKGGKSIPIDRAMEHVAGLTVILDVSTPYYHRLFRAASDPDDWFSDATASWVGKKTDTFCPMGPYLTTMDEIGSPYDLLIYTRQSGWLRDRSHTNSMLIGIERLVCWLSTFMTLCPGDVLHMATMGVDGMRILPEMPFGPQDFIEGEIERVGTLRVPVVRAAQQDWRTEDDPSLAVHPSPAVRDLVERGDTALSSPDGWSPGMARHFWTVYGDYETAGDEEGIPPCRLPRVLNGPASALGTSGGLIQISQRGGALSLGPELAFVVGRLAKRVSEEDAENYILGYLAMASIMDHSFSEPIREPVTLQARSMPGVYGRWGDGYNPVSGTPVALPAAQVRDRVMLLAVDGLGEIRSNTNAYLLLAPRILSFISDQVTLFPGDVVTLGRIGRRLTIPSAHQLSPRTTLRAIVEGVGEVQATLVDQRSTRIPDEGER